MLRFMKPGFHSGTLPSLYGKLRLAQHKGQGHKTVKFEEGLHHVEAAIERFTTQIFDQDIVNGADAGAVEDPC